MIAIKLGPPSRPWVLAVVAAAICCAAALAGMTGIWEPDTFHHLAVGRQLMRRGLFGGDDPFLFPLAGQGTGLMPYWLGSAVIYGAHRLFGEAGPVYLVALAGACLLLLLFWDCMGTGALEGEHWALRLVCALVPLALFIPIYRERSAPRPEIFCNLFLALTLLALRRHDAGKSRLLYFLPAVGLLWTNLHTSELLGAGVMFAYVFTGLLGRLVARLRGQALPGTPSRLGLARVAAVAAAFTALGAVNPSPQSPLVSAFQVATSTVGIEIGPSRLQPVMSVLRSSVGELQPLGPEVVWQPLGVLLLLTAASFLAAGRRAVSWELVVVTLLTLLAFRSRRFGGLAAIASVPVAARNLATAVKRLGSPRFARISLAAAAAALVAFGGWGAVHLAGYRLGTGVVPERFPVRAAEYLSAIVPSPSERLFNSFELGGYLEWRLDRAVFQDGRGLLPDGEEEAVLATPVLPQEFARWDARYRFDALVVSYPRLDSTEMDLMRGMSHAPWGVDRNLWSLVAFDEGGMIFLRRDGTYAQRAAQDEYRFVRPELPFSRDQIADPETARGVHSDLRRAVAEAPSCGSCRAKLALVLVNLHQDPEAESLLLPVASGRFSPGAVLTALDTLAGIAERRGDRTAARRFYQRALSIGLGRLIPRRSLAFLALDDGDVSRASRLVAQNLADSPRSRDDLVLAIDIARRQGRSGEVVALSRRLQQAAGTNGADLLCGTAIEYEKGGDRAQAVETYRSCLAVDPDGPLAASARQALARLGAAP